MALISLSMLPLSRAAPQGDVHSPLPDLVGEPVRAAGWHGPTKGLHTIAIAVHNFQGRIAIEGTLAVSPSAFDWFPVPLGPDGATVLDYPRVHASLLPAVAVPPGALAVPWLGAGGETSTLGVSFRINCVWLRAVVRRGHLAALPLAFAVSLSGAAADPLARFGHVDSILLNY